MGRRPGRLWHTSCPCGHAGSARRVPRRIYRTHTQAVRVHELGSSGALESPLLVWQERLPGDETKASLRSAHQTLWGRSPGWVNGQCRGSLVHTLALSHVHECTRWCLVHTHTHTLVTATCMCTCTRWFTVTRTCAHAHCLLPPASLSVGGARVQLSCSSVSLTPARLGPSRAGGCSPLTPAPSSTGPRHFLLICSVRPEDAGCIRFVAKAAASEASLQVEALPIRIVKPLRDKTALARHKATLECTVSQARGRVRWFRGDTEIFAGDKYEICNLDCYRTLIIHRVGPADEASYTCDAFDDRSTARLLVEGH
ncbi:obscurin, cytoskeletal calmodulin and titin-interacting RhoGEF [Chelydra serpentina]|uniref:Obscurin, cytoskeletal calmodulin and titin-interacting RhoGEF n=1 Tax=Chelydra serpentina TaxID=8475 RepID=A0A8T1RXS2_CHESE|nr:obscurin, cytoskeletal calmodulin and titin-interacting RhoGEF [Chelydra serpentina]